MLFDDMAKNLENYPELYDFVYDVLIIGKARSYQIDNPYVTQLEKGGYKDIICYGIAFYEKECMVKTM